MTAPIGKPPDVPPLEQVEKEMLVRALDNTGWNVALAARLLGVSRDTMRYRMEKTSVGAQRRAWHGHRRGRCR